MSLLFKKDGQDKGEGRLDLSSVEGKASNQGFMLSNNQGNIIESGPIFMDLLGVKQKHIAQSANILDIIKNNQDLQSNHSDVVRILDAIKSCKSIAVDILINSSSSTSSLKLISQPFGSKEILWNASICEAKSATHGKSKIDFDFAENLPIALAAIGNKGEVYSCNSNFSALLGIGNLSDKANLDDFIESFQSIADLKTPNAEIQSLINTDINISGRVLIKPQNGSGVFYGYFIQSPVYDAKGATLYSVAIIYPELYSGQSSGASLASRENNTHNNQLSDSPVESSQVALQGANSPLEEEMDSLYDLLNNLSVGLLILSSSDEILFSNDFINNSLCPNEDVAIIINNYSNIQKLLKNLSKPEPSHIVHNGIHCLVSGIRLRNGSVALTFSDQSQVDLLKDDLRAIRGLYSVGQLASAVSHDFNNLLTAIMGFADLIQTRIDHTDPYYTDIEHIRQNATRAMQMVRKLLTFSKKTQLKLEYFDANSLISGFKSTIGRLAGENIQLQIQKSPEDAVIHMDKTQLEQVITNLVVNAKDAMIKRGGVVNMIINIVTLNTPKDSVPDIIPSNTYVCISVQDQGLGIAKNDLEKIFQERYSTKGPKGNGFGLYNVRSILKENSSYIEVQSKVGRGSTFNIYIPYSGGEGVSALESSDIVSKNTIVDRDFSGVGVILLVDDEVHVRIVCKKALEMYGYHVIDLSDGESAINVLSSKKVDLIISDVVMPGMNGVELAKSAINIDQNLKVLLMSGYEEDFLQDNHGMPEGVFFISKPFGVEGLAMKVKKILLTK